MTFNSPDPPAGGSGYIEFKNTQSPDFAKNATGIFSEIGGLIHFCHSFPALKDDLTRLCGRAIDSFSIKHLYLN